MKFVIDDSQRRIVSIRQQIIIYLRGLHTLTSRRKPLRYKNLSKHTWDGNKNDFNEDENLVTLKSEMKRAMKDMKRGKPISENYVTEYLKKRSLIKWNEEFGLNLSTGREWSNDFLDLITMRYGKSSNLRNITITEPIA